MCHQGRVTRLFQFNRLKYYKLNQISKFFFDILPFVFPVEFWLLPLDHYLRIADDVTMDVYVKNPKGTRVALWDDVPSSRRASFQFALSELAMVGEWTVEVDTEGVTFKSAMNISNSRGATDPPKREQTITEEHFVELRFGREMRHKYKPGLPFLGKVSRIHGFSFFRFVNRYTKKFEVYS